MHIDQPLTSTLIGEGQEGGQMKHVVKMRYGAFHWNGFSECIKTPPLVKISHGTYAINLSLDYFSLTQIHQWSSYVTQYCIGCHISL